MKKKYPKYLIHEHTPESIRLRLEQKPRKASVRDFVYGAIDGTVTTFSIVAGVKGADLSTATILILGISNILADGFSMAASNYLGSKAEFDEKTLVKEFERGQIVTNPTGEAEEIRQIFKSKGFEGELLEKAVEMVVKDRDQWLKTMMMEEYGFSLENRSPLLSGAMTFIAFLLFGMVPLLSYIFRMKEAFSFAAVFTGIAFFILGALKSIWSLDHAWPSGLKTFVIGSLAASFAYIVGALLKDLA